MRNRIAAALLFGWALIGPAHAQDCLPQYHFLDLNKHTCPLPPAKVPNLPVQPPYERSLESWIGVKTNEANVPCDEFRYQHGRCL
jgi:hypothetical protein